MVRIERKPFITSSTRLFSSAEAARALGVSESSLKRWCDQGHVPFVRTAGGHRRLAPAAVLEFAREHGHAVVQPTALGMVRAAAHSDDASKAKQLTALLREGSEQGVRQLLGSLLVLGSSPEDVCDLIIAPSFAALGEAWAEGELEIYQERRACEITVRALIDWQALAPAPARRARVAIGGSFDHDPFAIPTVMAEITLRHQRYDARSLGVGLPVETLVAAIEASRPRLVWISVGEAADEDALVAKVARLELVARQAGAALVLGGRVLLAPLRSRLRCAAFCDGMRQLASFAAALGR